MLTRGMCANGPISVRNQRARARLLRHEADGGPRERGEFSARLARRTPAGRWGCPEELVGALLFRSSAASDFVNGQILYVDGGLTAVV